MHKGTWSRVPRIRFGFGEGGRGGEGVMTMDIGRSRRAKMQTGSLRDLAVSIGKETHMSEVGANGMASCVGPKLGTRVPYGAGFSMNVTVAESMRRSIGQRVREVDFTIEVREHVPEVKSLRSCQIKPVLCRSLAVCH